jgi:hypothetical protein
MSEIQVNTINEYTGANGVTIDGALIKDSQLAATAGGGLVLLETRTASSSSELLLDNFVDTSIYSSYYIAVDNIIPATNNVNFRVVFRTGGASGADKTGTYARGYAYNYLETASSSSGARANYTDYGVLADNVGNAGGSVHALQAIGQFFPGNGTNSTAIIQMPMTQRQSSGSVVGYYQNAIIVENLYAATGLRFYLGSGNIASGSIHIFGVKK